MASGEPRNPFIPWVVGLLALGVLLVGLPTLFADEIRRLFGYQDWREHHRQMDAAEARHKAWVAAQAAAAQAAAASSGVDAGVAPSRGAEVGQTGPD